MKTSAQLARRGGRSFGSQPRLTRITQIDFSRTDNRQPITDSPKDESASPRRVRPLADVANLRSPMSDLRRLTSGFTLIELLVVIIMIAILASLLYPAINGAQRQAKNVQAKNDLTQIVSAVNAYYTEYGKYPTSATTDATATFKTDNNDVINTLRAIAVAGGANAGDVLNPRKIVFLSPPNVKDNTNPRAGVDSNGIYYDPWGKAAGKPEAGIYHIALDGNYDNQIANPYSSNAGPTTLQAGVIAWSLGSDGSGGSGDKNATTSADDVISWQ